MNAKKLLPRFSIIFLILLWIAGCSAPYTMIKKRNLDVQTQMSETIFLEPVAPSRRIVFIDVRNTSDKELPIEQLIRNRVVAHGFTITDDPEQANYMLQANILKVEKSDLRSSGSMLESGFGGAILGSTISQTGSYSSYREANREQAKGMLIGATVAMVADALVDDVLFTMVTDLRVRERPSNDETVTQTEKSHLNQGTSTTQKQRVTGGRSNWKTYQSRIVSTANQANLEFDGARDVLMEGLVRSIGGIF
ncbi:MAG: complement resistance protein TraT [Chromatiales bacterium]|nr:complement resistance protein TraT [Chromatiales bacterium]